MAGIDDILKQLPIGEIASKLGVDNETAEKAVREGGASILGGLQRNASSEEGAEKLQHALKKHATTKAESLDDVDTEDGNKILQHVFGGQKDVVAADLTADKETAGIDFGKLLPMLAPIIMSVVGKVQHSEPAKKAEASGGGISDLLGGLLGGLTGGGNSSNKGGIDLGGILGGLGGLFGKK